eukprot:CAMPEP_0170447264 /NCGR_PEP_ID=MMETSP0117_2-20130122/50069_1 /TAXON_ID=400756 /ORGANISM="Durinskia baltica, Strain CSIRO CS-38" /LENGTH=39 /DNA_ID= /DNA_START= /DNA_END= /DNA_ORIENTATION=
MSTFNNGIRTEATGLGGPGSGPRTPRKYSSVKSVQAETA